MGEERRGVLREMRLVTGESRVTSLAEKPGLTSKHADNGAHAHSAAHTNVTRENQEVVVGQTAVVLGVEKGLDVDAIALGVVALDNVKGVLEVEDLLLGKNGNLSGHFGRVSCVE
jgi:glucose-6-phosphate dehydrogenase assembly protein OpcA